MASRSRVRSRIGGGSAVATPLAIAKTFFQEWIDPTDAASIPGGSPVSLIKSQIAGDFANPANFQRSTGASPADRPTVASSRIVFDGTDDVLDYAEEYTFIAGATPADPFYSAPGKGPTVTGLSFAADGTAWVGHFGKLNQTTAAGETFDGSLIHYNVDPVTQLPTTIIQEIRFSQAPISLADVGCQGVVVDPQDGTLWCADQNNGRIYNINPVGPVLVKNFAFAGANGLAYETINNQLLVSTATSLTITRVNKSTGATISTLTNFLRDITDNQNDHLFFDGSEGSAGVIYQTVRDNQTNGRVEKYDVATGVPLKPWSFPEIQCIEALTIRNGYFYICDDQGYHNGPLGVNRVCKIAVDPSSADFGTRLIISGVAKIAATPASTKCLLSLGDAIQTASNVKKGIWLGFTTVANNFRVIVILNGTQVVVDHAITSTTTEFLFHIDFDSAAHTITSHFNGVLVVGTVTGSLANVTGSIPRMWPTLGGDYGGVTGVAARFSNTTHGGLITSTDGTHRFEIEGQNNWGRNGVDKGLLPVGHLYKNSAPT